MARNDDRRDSLTDLASRGRLERSLNRRCGRRIGGSIVPSGDTVVLIDVVGLKAVNRSRGFLAGDDLIVKVARRLVRLSRGVALVGRLGGDEFAVLLLESDASATRWTAARVQESLAIAGIQASVGWSLLDGSRDLDTALHEADAAMYASKCVRRQFTLDAGPARAASVRLAVHASDDWARWRRSS